MMEIPNSNSISAVVVTYNPGPGLTLLIDSLLRQANEIFIVDNASTTGLEFLDKVSSNNRVKRIENSENLGIAAALNQGCRAAKEAGYYWALAFDQDSLPSENLVDSLILSMSRNGSLDSACAFVALGVDTVKEKSLSHNYSKDSGIFEVIPISVSITSGSLFNLEVMEKLGYMKEELFIDFVDHEYTLRAKQSGYITYEVPSANFSHNLGEGKKKKFLFWTVYPTFHSPVRRYYMARNRVYLWKNVRKGNWKPLLYTTFRQFLGLLKMWVFEDQKWKKSQMTFLGLWDGIRGKYGKADFS